MPLLATPGEKQERKLPPAGPTMARIVNIIDLGRQKTKFANTDGTPKVSHKVFITWELPSRKTVFKQERGEEPFIIAKEYTVSTNEKSSFRKDSESWLGRKLSDKEAAGFDVFSLLDTSGLLTVVHNRQGEETYANIGSLSPLMEGMACPPRVFPLVQYEITQGKSDTFNALPEWIRKKVESSTDWKLPF